MHNLSVGEFILKHTDLRVRQVAETDWVRLNPWSLACWYYAIEFNLPLIL